LGEGGAGKSTAAANSAAVNIPVIADDHVFILRDAEQDFTLSLAPKWPSQLSTHPDLRPPLRGIFVLVKDTVDRLIPVSQTRTARMLLKGFQELPTSALLSSDLVRQAFQTCANIARTVPGYELHFRKSPDFWDVIDVEFPPD
jgi:hypothetical protein